MWVLRSTLTLKTTDTTLVSVDGDIGQRGALIHLPHANPGTTTLRGDIPVPLSHQHNPMDVVRLDLGNPMDVVRLDLGRDRAQDQVPAQE